MSTAETAAVSAEGLRMTYGTTEVLHGVDLRLAPGEVVALLGPNGAGKTTTLELLEGLRAPSAGSVRVLGVDPLHGDEAWRARLGVVLQSWRDHARWHVRDLLDHLGAFYSPYSSPGRPRPWPTDDLLARVGLTHRAQHRIMTLSGGERRRLDVAVGLVGRPDVLFLDEPTAGFDPEARRDLHDLLQGLADDETTILLTTHDLDEAERLAGRILVLAGGRIVADGSPDALRARVTTRGEVRWRAGDETFVHGTTDAVDFVRTLLTGPDGAAVRDLEVTRATLEEAYLQLVRQVEHGERPGSPVSLLAGEAVGLGSVPAPVHAPAATTAGPAAGRADTTTLEDER